MLRDGEPPDYEWIPLTDLPETDRATVARTYVEAAAVAYDRGAMDENETRKRLSTVEFFGELPPLSDADLEARRGPPTGMEEDDPFGGRADDDSEDEEPAEE